MMRIELMRCPQCQGENRDTARFCEECGNRLVRTCPNCGYEVSPRANFCLECSTQLTTTSRHVLWDTRDADTRGRGA
jgi:predicted amidophosphoribosyltransferase